jgi:hypothetical protein
MGALETDQFEAADAARRRAHIWIHSEMVIIRFAGSTQHRP